MLRSEQRRPSCAVPAQLLAITTTYSDLAQLRCSRAVGGYIRRGLQRHALKLVLIVKPREHNRGAARLSGSSGRKYEKPKAQCFCGAQSNLPRPAALNQDRDREILAVLP